MRLQVVQFSADSSERDGITFSPLSAPRALDDFDVNIVDLSSVGIWRCYEDTCGKVDCLCDLQTICQMVRSRQRAIVIYVFPQNIRYKYRMEYDRVNGSLSKALKDMLEEMYKYTITAAIPRYTNYAKIFYEKTETDVGGYKYNADFCFNYNDDVITRSCKSKKNTTVIIEDLIYATTLNITQNIDGLKHYISVLFPEREQPEAPEWMNGICFGDDVEQREKIAVYEEKIKEASDQIEAAKAKLKQNDRVKSILYANGDHLVSVVFEILEKLLDCDLSEFVDKKKEDFLIKKSSCTFIGEIKGVTSNVKHEHISQIELHYRGYLDRLDDEGISESEKQLLIINPFRSKPLDQREPVHKEQITLAERNGCLIIETHTLMRMYENYCLGLLTAQRCEEIFAKCTGVLKKSDFDDSQSQG